MHFGTSSNGSSCSCLARVDSTSLSDHRHLHTLMGIGYAWTKMRFIWKPNPVKFSPLHRGLFVRANWSTITLNLTYRSDYRSVSNSQFIHNVMYDNTFTKSKWSLRCSMCRFGLQLKAHTKALCNKRFSGTCNEALNHTTPQPGVEL